MMHHEQEWKEVHKEIIADICLLINNCADCHNDETGKTDCFPLRCVELHDETVDSFCIEPYTDKNTNRKLCDIASQHGYEADLITEGNEVSAIKFWKLNIPL